MGVCIVGTQRLGVLAVLRRLDCVSHALCHLKPWQKKLREVHSLESANSAPNLSGGVPPSKLLGFNPCLIHRRGDPPHHILHLAGIADVPVVGLQNPVDILISVQRGIRQGSGHGANACGRR